VKTKAAILVEQRKPLVIDEIEVPALKYGQVLVRIAYSGICGSQLGEADGVKGPDKFLPHLLGHEAGGRVLETGEGVTKVRRDDKVVLHWMKGDGINSPTPGYGWGGRTVNAGWVTTFNELAVVSENRVTAMPAGGDMRTAPLFGCAIPTGFGVVNNDARLKLGESLVVYGAGGVGLSAILAASLSSAHPVIAVDVSDEKLALAGRFGAAHLVNAKKEDAEAAVRKILGAGGADAVVDTTGDPRVIEKAYGLTSARGRTILVGVPRKGDDISIYSLPLHFGKRLSGSYGGGVDPSYDIPRYMALCARRKTDLSGMISAVFPLDAINDAFEELRGGRIAGRCLLDMRAAG